MNIVYATDHNFVMQCGVSLTSLLENNADLELAIFVLDFGLTQQDHSLLQQTAGEVKLTFIDAQEALSHIHFVFDTGSFHPVVLTRLLLADYLPATVEETLYLDSDTVVNGSLKELEEKYSFNSFSRKDPDEIIAGANAAATLLAAVPELYMPEAKKRDIGLNPEDIYYNAGVLWINLRGWRQERLQDQFLAYYKERNGHLPYNDQDIINHCCRGRFVTLPVRYNMNPNLPYFPFWYIRRMQSAYCRETPGNLQDQFQEESAPDQGRRWYRDQLNDPVIVHYMGDERPWLTHNHNYYRQLFEQYKAMSLWRDAPMQPGRRGYLACYHLLNELTRIFPHGRRLFTDLIGINVYRWKKKD